MDDDISVEYFSGYLNLGVFKLVQNTQACSSLCTQGRHTLELDCSNAIGQALTTISCVDS
jgi:hypothetical protein